MLKSFQILGYSAAIPSNNRGVTCLIVSTEQFDIMIDCGEGTYLKWIYAGYTWNSLKYIFITHMHPDHTGGLVNFLFYRKLLGITSPLKIWGPPFLEEYLLNSFQLQSIRINYEIEIFSIQDKLTFKLPSNISITIREMIHRIPCWAYRIEDKNKSLVFVTDTLPNDNTIELAKNADILVHEATFLDSHSELAEKTFHTTRSQAFEIADKAKVNQLILTHFSQRINNKDLDKIFYNGLPCVVYDKAIEL